MILDCGEQGNIHFLRRTIMLTIAGGILIAFFVIVVLEVLCDDGRRY
jgi:hypothetical protein